MEAHALIVHFSAAGWVATALSVATLAGSGERWRVRFAGWIIAAALLLAAGVWVSPEGELAVAAWAMLPALAFLIATQHLVPRRMSAWWWVVPLELLALLLATQLGGGEATAQAWFWPVEIALRGVPPAFALVGGIAWWRGFAAMKLARSAGVALAAAIALPVLWPAGGPLTLSLAWLAAATLGATALAAPWARTRPALIVIGVGFVALVLTPLAGTLAENEARAREKAALIETAQARVLALRRLQPPDFDRSDLATRQLAAELAQAVDDGRAQDYALKSARLWRVRGAEWQTLGNEGVFSRAREPKEDERMLAMKTSPVVWWPDDSPGAPGVVTVHAPLRAIPFEAPPAWLALDYPAALFVARFEAARRTAWIAGALLAAIAGGVFVLIGRLAREAEERATADRARAADRAKTEFLAFLGHELRTPLQVILGRAELLEAGDPTAVTHARETITTQGRLMLRLVTDLLDLGTLEAGRFALHPQRVALRALVVAAAENARLAASAKGLECEVTVDDKVPELVSVDESRLLQILGNLLGNAVKYTAQGEVSLRVDVVGDTAAESAVTRVRFVVSDTGIGLPPEKIARLFTLFTRLDSGATYTREGTGVGLALVQRLVGLMDGTVTAANRTDGRGAEFAVELPLRLELAPLVAEFDQPTLVSAANPVDAQTVQRRRVLVAEDHPAVAELLADHVRAGGGQPVVVRDGVSALEWAWRQRFDVVLLDVNLPGCDGIAVARQLARFEPRPRVIMCSAEVLPETRAAAEAAGIEAFLAKPVTRADVARALGFPAWVGERSATANFFEALQTVEQAGRVRATALATLPAARAALEAAVARGDATEIARCAHFLRNTALVLGDPAIEAEAEAARKRERSNPVG